MTVERESLRRAIKPRSLFTLSFGTIIGVGWITVLGSWLVQAGSIGAIVGFALGGVAMILIGLCYAEAATMYPVSGGEVAYVYEMYGTKMAFAAGWFLTFSYVAVTSFEAVSVGWVLSALVPGFGGPVLYTVLGTEVRLWALLVGLGIMAIVTAINYRGARTSSLFQDLMTFALLALSAFFVGAGLLRGHVSNLEPLFVGDGAMGALAGVLAVFATAPFWFAGFDTIPQAMGEVEEGARLYLIPRVIVLSITLALLFYAAVILTASVSLPRDELLALELPVQGALEATFRSVAMGKIVLLAGLCGLITTWNAIFFAASRLVFSLGRAHMIPHVFGHVHARFGSPSFAVLFVGGVGAIGTLFGRRAILPIVNASTTCLALVFVLVCAGIARLRRSRPEHARPFRAPGGGPLAYGAAALSALMLYLSVYQPYRDAGGIPSEWLVLLVWAALGRLFWGMGARLRDEVSEADRRYLILDETGDS